MTPSQANQALRATWEETLAALHLSLTTHHPNRPHPGVAFGRAALTKACEAIVRSTHAIGDTTEPDDVPSQLCAALATRYALTEMFDIEARWRPLRHPAWTEALRGPKAHALRSGLLQTHAIASEAKRLGVDGPWREVPPLHPTGVAPSTRDETCGSCAWSVRTSEGDLTCQQVTRANDVGAALTADTAACYRHEPRLTASHCLACGACCRGGFDRVTVEPESSLIQARPDWIVEESGTRYLPRPRGLCVALEPSSDGAWPCTVYAQRPRACREFEVGGDACLLARRRVGLSHD